MKMKIKITLKSDLCAGSGQSLGNRVDTDICTDSHGLPYIPARRLKGCLRATAEELKDMGCPFAKDENISVLFGDRLGKNGSLIINDAILDESSKINSWIDRQRSDGSDIVRKALHPERVSRIYSYRRGQTRLENGVKVDSTLRFINVLKHYDPMDLNGNKEMVFYSLVSVDGDNDITELFKACCRALRHIGLNRNRGLGHIEIETFETEEAADTAGMACELELDQKYVIEYRVVSDAPLCLPECDDIRTSIPARTVIGAMSGVYLGKYENSCDSTFDSLFLNGDVKWSSLTPVIHGEKSYPVPMFVVKLKNDSGKLINRFCQHDSKWKSLKPKTVESGYMAKCDNKFVIADIPVRTVYHNSITGRNTGSTGLYMQPSVDSGYIYSGTVEFPGRMADFIIKLLSNKELYFGRSRTAQYSSCHILSVGNPEKTDTGMNSYIAGQPVYLVAKSDIYLPVSGVSLPSEKEIRELLTGMIGADNIVPEDKMDVCGYATISGFNNMWHLQKLHIQVIRAGSVFCFTASKEEYPKYIRIGCCLQEGFGYCELLSEEGIESVSVIEDGMADRFESGTEDTEESIVRFRSMILSNLYMEMISKNAEAVAKEVMKLKGTSVDNKAKKRKGIPQGKMRLLLAEATDYSELRAKVDDIKESDVDSSSIGRKWECHELLDRLYGSDREKISVETMINAGGKETLNDLDDQTRERLCSDWKKPLDIALHSLHYAKGGRR